MEGTAHLRLCRGNLVESTEYAALRTDSFASMVDSMIDSNVALDGGSDRIMVFRTSFSDETIHGSESDAEKQIQN